MSRPCAYCKTPGHHIRDCSELAEKNRRQEMKKSITAKTETIKIPIPSHNKHPKNAFANLYSSSDDEIEEGEIIETHSDEGSLSSSNSDNAWNRSGLKSIYIPTPTCDKTSTSLKNNPEDEEEEDDRPEYVYVHIPCDITLKYKGWSWADIEYDTE